MTDDEWQAHVTHEAAIGDRRMARRKRKASSANPLFDHARARGHGAERDQPLHRAGLAADRGTPDEPGSRRLSTLLLGVRVCAVCGRAAAASTTSTSSGRTATRPTAFCSLRCHRRRRRHRQEEQRHDRQDRHGDSRRSRTRGAFFAEVLTELGLMAPFHDRTPTRSTASSRPASTASRIDAAPGAQRRHPILRSPCTMIDLNSRLGLRLRRRSAGRRRVGAPHQRADRRRADERASPQPPRDYLGGSRIGEPCARRLVYEVTQCAGR